MRQISTVREKPSTRHFGVVAGLFAVALTAVALAATVSPAAAATQGQLEKAGWTCIAPLPVTDEQHCARPGGFERFVSGEAKTMTFLVFDASGKDYLGTEFNIRGDLFHGQPCPTDPPTYEYTYLGPIFGLDYWACHRFDSDHL